MVTAIVPARPAFVYPPSLRAYRQEIAESRHAALRLTETMKIRSLARVARFDPRFSFFRAVTETFSTTARELSCPGIAEGPHCLRPAGTLGMVRRPVPDRLQDKAWRVTR